jgi:hypothetical protein
MIVCKWNVSGRVNSFSQAQSSLYVAVTVIVKKDLSSNHALVPTAETRTEYKPGGIDVFIVMRLFAEIPKKPAAPLVKIKFADRPTLLASSKVSFPTTAPAAAFVETV